MSFAYDSAACKITSNHSDNILQILVRKQEQKSVLKLFFRHYLDHFTRTQL